jgi:hypothetical protein
MAVVGPHSSEQAEARDMQGMPTWCTVLCSGAARLSVPAVDKVLEQCIPPGVECCCCCSRFKHGCSDGVASRQIPCGSQALPRRHRSTRMQQGIV